MNVPQTSLELSHFPVMLKEVIRICSPEKGGNFVDCTFGGGGFSEELLKFPNTKVTALDRDKFAAEKANKISKKHLGRFSFYNEKFSNLDKILDGKDKVDTIIFDLGMSLFQLKDLSRGFSFKSNNKIDMNMGLSLISAEEVLNNFDENSLKLIIKILGEEKESAKIVNNILKAREVKNISKVPELVEIIKNSKRKNFSKKINICTKTFQALRIFVNKETTELIEGIIKATKLIKIGGKIIIISFHSIEDKIVKFYFKNYSENNLKPSRYLPEEKVKKLIFFKEKKNNLIRPTEREIKENPPSRSAKLRFVTRNEKTFEEPMVFRKKFKKYLDLEGLNV
tara:strand:- start:211 stop:1227 length:1017 start_codon:yes stop_codon:yes gene_type:complete